MKEMNIIGNFTNKDGRKELGKLVDGKYSKTSFDELTHPDFFPEFRFKYRSLFDKVTYEYQVRDETTVFEKGLIYFYDLDSRGGRYKLISNIDQSEKEDRYGRFSYWTMGGILELTGNGTDRILGSYIRINHFMDSQTLVKVKKRPYSNQLPSDVWLEFEKVNDT